MAEQKTHFVTILTASPALGSILSMVLDCEEHLNVQTFDSVASLECHLRIAPVDLIVCDYEMEHTTAPRLIVQLRKSNPARRFETIMLTPSLSPDLRQACKFAAINEVIVKPMSPLFVRDRVNSRLRKMAKQSDIGAKKKRPAFAPSPFHTNGGQQTGDNIIPLFANRDVLDRPRV